MGRLEREYRIAHRASAFGLKVVKELGYDKSVLIYDDTGQLRTRLFSADAQTSSELGPKWSWKQVLSGVERWLDELEAGVDDLNVLGRKTM